MRLGAFLVDYALIVSIFFGIYFLLGWVPLSLTGVGNSAEKWPTFLFLFLYFAVMESSKYQATFGKLLFRLRVCDYSFKRISFPRALLRYLARAVFGASLFAMMWTVSMQGLHDLMTKTLVLELRDMKTHRRNLSKVKTNK